MQDTWTWRSIYDTQFSNFFLFKSWFSAILSPLVQMYNVLLPVRGTVWAAEMESKVCFYIDIKAVLKIRERNVPTGIRVFSRKIESF